MVQPYLLWLTSNRCEGEFYIKTEKANIYVGNNPLLAFDRLFKAHFIFDTHDDVDVMHFFRFVEYISGHRDSLTPTQQEFVYKLSAAKK